MTPNHPPILILDDDSMIAATLKVTLAHEKFDVVICSSPLEALELVAARDFAVFISDNKMSEMTGLDFLAECRRLRPQSSRFLLTGEFDLSSVMEAMERGEIARFFTKPWEREDLITAVRDAVRRHEFAIHNE